MENYKTTERLTNKMVQNLYGCSKPTAQILIKEMKHYYKTERLIMNHYNDYFKIKVRNS